MTLLNVDGKKERTRKRLVASVNKAAGRQIAIYRRGYPVCFPFAADCWYLIPGYLPDGRMAMAVEDLQSTPPKLCVVTFDKRGNQTKDVLLVPLSPELEAIPVNELYWHKDLLRQHLIATRGFRPAFIRIRGCDFPGDDGYYSPHRGHEEYWELLGYPDTDDESSWMEEPDGNGGRITWLVRDGQYILGWDRWADKRGHVHST